MTAIHGPMPKPLPPIKAPLQIGVWPDPVMPLGRHKGQRVSTVDRDYLQNLYSGHLTKLRKHDGLEDAVKHWRRKPLSCEVR